MITSGDAPAPSLFAAHGFARSFSGTRAGACALLWSAVFAPACAAPSSAGSSNGPVRPAFARASVANVALAPAQAPPATTAGNEAAHSPTKAATPGHARATALSPDVRRTRELLVPNHRPAVVSVPPGTESAPVLIAAHGAGGLAENHCAFWSEHVGAHAYVLCPRGVPMTRHPQTGYFYRHHHALGEEVRDAIAALKREYPRADVRGMVYAGYSQGAIMGTLHAHTVPQQLSRLLLIEGGFDEWDVPTARRFRELGGKRVALVCGIAHCGAGAKRARVMLRRGEVPVRFEHVAGGGHTYLGRVGDRARELLTWLVEDDPRWAGYRVSRRAAGSAQR